MMPRPAFVASEVDHATRQSLLAAFGRDGGWTKTSISFEAKAKELATKHLARLAAGTAGKKAAKTVAPAMEKPTALKQALDALTNPQMPDVALMGAAAFGVVGAVPSLDAAQCRRAATAATSC